MKYIPFYIPPQFYRLFSLKPGVNYNYLKKKKDVFFAEQSEEQFRENNPKTYHEVTSAWEVLTNPLTSPYLILGAHKETTLEQLERNYSDLIAKYPLSQNSEAYEKISHALGILEDPEDRVFVNFFTFDESVWDLALLESDNEIEVRRRIEMEFSGDISRQIINSTIYCYYKALQIEEEEEDREKAASFWKTSYLGWQGILNEGFLWEEIRNRVETSNIYHENVARGFDDDSIGRIKKRLRAILIENAVRRCIKVLPESVDGALEHLKFLKFIGIESSENRKIVARMYNQCAYRFSLEGRLDEIEKLLEESLRLDPQLTEAQSNLEIIHSATSGTGQALRHLATGNEEEAAALLRAIIKENPDNQHARDLLGAVLHKSAHEAFSKDEISLARAMLEEAVQYREDLAEELDIIRKKEKSETLSRAIHNLENQEWESATRFLKDFYDKYPEEKTAGKLLAAVYNRVALLRKDNREWVKAKDNIKKSLEIEPDNEIYRENLSRIERTAEKQQVASDIARAVELTENDKPEESIEILQPIYTEQKLPLTVENEVRESLAEAYIKRGIQLIHEAESAVSRGSIKEAFESAHKHFTIADFLNRSEDSEQNLSRLEDALPELMDKKYEERIYPQPPGKKRKIVRRGGLLRILRSRIRGPVEFLQVAFTVPKMMPLVFFPLLIISLLVMVLILNGGFLWGILLALLIHASLSAFFINRLNEEKRKSMTLLTIFAGLAALAVLGFSIMPPMQKTIKKPVSPKKTPEPTPTPLPAVNYFPKDPDAPGFFAPVLDGLAKRVALLGKSAESASGNQEEQLSAGTPTPRPTTTPEPTPTPTPSVVGRSIEIAFQIKNFLGVRQGNNPVFMYSITTPQGTATLIMDPLVYIKLPKNQLSEGGRVKAKVKVVRDIGHRLYSLESPGDFDI